VGFKKSAHTSFIGRLLLHVVVACLDALAADVVAIDTAFAGGAVVVVAVEAFVVERAVVVVVRSLAWKTLVLLLLIRMLLLLLLLALMMVDSTWKHLQTQSYIHHK
jgi:hypothetical protein